MDTHALPQDQAPMAPVAAAEPPAAVAREPWHFHVPSLVALGPFLALLAACAFFALQTDRFLSAQNFALIAQQVMVVGLLAIGQTLIILTAGIDLSCGMVMALGGIVMSKLAVDAGLPPALAIACGLGVTTLFGLANGLLVTRIKLPSFIVTLGTMNIAFALTQIYSSSQTTTGLPDALTVLGNTFPVAGAEVSYGVLMMLALYVLAWLALRETAPGRHIYAVGNNSEAARLTGIPVKRVLLSVYIIAGLMYGLAALLSVARTGVGDPNAGQTENLDAITAVVLGGTSLFGGRGVILGTLVGAMIVGVFRNGLTLMGVSSIYQVLVTGVLVILAVAFDQLSRRGGRA
jgi:fructose transport system permease protein